MPDMVAQLPTLAFIEAQVVHRAVGQGALGTATRQVERAYGLKEGSLGNGVYLESRMVALLYCLILVPKEIWARDPKQKHPIYDVLAAKWSVQDGEVLLPSKEYEEHPVFWFVHHLRNAVAHVNFAMEAGRFRFWDHPPGQDTAVRFEASLSFPRLHAFLEIVGATLANLRNPSAV